ncbi:pyridoxamine 5'-phosphate oxidase family protein [Methylobacterium sp. SD274]|uniref:pyridoxamine 5'-phosphate oxidase family protein n=1 Tax=Methylobacterium sp. SD274 TaxID=2782009 RepID=UPI001A977C18|nr:pyridoxamine 5'-phosphate oxidase family protein [Methylobacterium sp. SD274]MBO1021088.1 pyridoxamine 5'-phosphate oxidase family protein [Methylobacterium sp. SD274]
MSLSDHHPASPWHPGEIAIQNHAGVTERMAEIGPRVIRDRMIDQHRDFFRHLPFVVLGAVDPKGEVWATIRAGEPGFLDAPDPFRLRVRSAADPHDPAEAGLADGSAVGLLGIDLTTRRRNRLNGIVRREGGDEFEVRVQQSFGNCPQYIRVRQGPERLLVPVAAAPEIAHGLDDRARALIAGADTFFVATYADGEQGNRQVDVSHRGGPKGFVRIGENDVLTVPDYSGNRFFNTLGNIRANPRAGLVFIDFTSGDLLQMSGRAEVLLDTPEIASFPGAERLWRFAPRTLVRRVGAVPLRFEAASPPGGA